MPEPVDLGYAVNLPPERAIEYFRSKGYALSWNWPEVWQQQHARAFTVAKAMKLDVLEDLRGAVDRALADGQTFRQFASDDLVDTLVRKGWWGKQERVNPNTGELELVQLGSHHRLRTIFRTNIATARAASRYQAMRENAAERPYWMYDAMDDSRTRPSHAALDNLVFRFDDPFWDTHFPPNGWNCRCRVRAFTARDVERRGLQIQRSRPGDFRPVDHTVTGGLDVQTLNYRGIMSPDPGWNYRPGLSPTVPGGPAGTVGSAPWQALRGVVPGQKGPGDFGLPAAWPPGAALRAERLPETATSQEAAAAIYSALGWGGRRIPGDERTLIHTVRTPGRLEDVQIDHAFVDHVARHPSRGQFANYILPTLQEPHEVWLTWVGSTSGPLLRPHFFAAFEDGRTAVIAIDAKNAWVAWTLYTTDKSRQVDRRRAGELLYRRGGGG